MGQTKLRTTQMSGSMSDLVYSGSRTSAGNPSTLTAAQVPHLGAVLGQFAGAIGRITGKTGTAASGFTNSAEGVFAPSIFDVDTAGAMTLDSATSIAIGTNADKPIDIDSTTLDIDASDAITIDSTAAITISGDTGASIGDDTEALAFDGSGNVDFDAVALDIDASGAITIDGASTLSIDAVDDSNLTVTAEAKDLDIAVAGGGAQELRLASAGTGASALHLNASAGGMDIDVADMLDIDVADEITIDTTSADGHIAVTSAHTAGQAILISANAAAGSILDIDAGIVDFDVQGNYSLDAGGAFSVDAVGASNVTTNGVLTLSGSTGVSLLAHKNNISISSTQGDVVVEGSTFSGNDLTVPGNLTVQGTTTQVDTTNLQVKDKNILINDGGSTAGTTGAGLDIEGDSAAVVGYIKVGASDNSIFELKAPGNAGVLTVDIDATKTLTVAGALNIEGDSVINQDLSTDSTAVTFAGLDMSDGNIANVGDIDADSVSVADAANGLNIDFSGGNTEKSKITLADNLADALTVTEGSNPYMRFVSTNSAENIQFHKMTVIVDTQKLRLGSGTGAANDLELIHDGTDSIIQNHTGLFKVEQKAAGAALMLSASHRGAVEVQSGGEIFFIDSNFSGSVSDGRGLALTSKGGSLGTGKEEINQYVRNFGQSSLIKAINSAFYASGSGGDPSRTVKTLTADVAANGRAFGAGNGFSTVGISEADIDKALTVYVNGQLLLSGSSADYVLNQASGRGDTDIACKFELQVSDVIQAIVKP